MSRIYKVNDNQKFLFAPVNHFIIENGGCPKSVISRRVLWTMSEAKSAKASAKGIPLEPLGKSPHSFQKEISHFVRNDNPEL